MERQARLVVEAREDVRIRSRSRGAGCGGCRRRDLRQLNGGIRHLPVRRPGSAGRGDLAPLASVLECPLFLVR